MRWFKKKGNEEPPRVRIYDFDTGVVSTIPAAELAPGMARAHVNGVAGEVWIDASRVQKNPEFQHPPFSEEIRDLLRSIKAALDEVYPMSLADWEDGFRRDRTPEREIAYWLHMAQVYSRLTAPDDPLGRTVEQRQEVFKVLTACGVAPRDQVLTIVERRVLSRDDAQRIVHSFFGEQA